MRMNTTKEEALRKFYDFFQVGLEVEGSFLNMQSSVSEAFEVSGSNDENGATRTTGDGSVSDVSGSHWTGEVQGRILRSDEDEARWLSAFDTLSEEYEGRKIFALRNPTAGTHIHVDVKRGSEKTEAMLAFDSVDFEKYFFLEYFKAFNSQKFAQRLNNRYCARFFLGNDVSLPYIEERKGSRERYRWLNTECITEGQGIEVRVFPYLQTVEGLREVLSFTKTVFLRYYLLPKTQKRVRDIQSFVEKCGGLSRGFFRVDVRKLNHFEKTLFDVLKVERSELRLQSAETFEFLCELYKAKPSAFTFGEPIE